MPNGIPSHDTFARVLARIDPEQFQRSFLNWIQSIEKVTEKEVVAIDGKTLRRSYDTKSEKSAIHLISAWANSSSLVLGQRKVRDKSNEITAIPELLKVLELKGCIVTIDAMGCQKEKMKIPGSSHICTKTPKLLALLKIEMREHVSFVNNFFLPTNN